jgi:uncharacterized protein (DUF488 family)
LEIFTIGFAGKTAEQFFESLKRAGVEQLVDVRLNNVSQLAGFTKKSDLPYLLASIAGIGYRHELLLAPAEELLKAYRSKEIDWETYARRYQDLLAERAVAKELRPSDFARRIALLCSEPKADRCHRRLAAEYLQAHWRDVNIEHL